MKIKDKVVTKNEAVRLSFLLGFLTNLIFSLLFFWVLALFGIETPYLFISTVVSVLLILFTMARSRFDIDIKIKR